MDREFQVERVALHLVDRKEAEPRLAPREIDLTVFDPDEAHVIHDFFSGHLDKVWEAREGRRTFAAKFRSDAMGQHYQAISADASTFFERSCQIAQRLHTVSKKVPASPGLLMVLWLRVPGDEQPYLGLFKMEPGRRADQAGVARPPGSGAQVGRDPPPNARRVRRQGQG
jgi:hypothetical protein